MTHHPDRAAQMREACARLAKNGAVAAFQQATEAQGDEVLYHTRTDVFDAIGKALSECQRQIEHLPLPGEAPDAAARPAPCIPASDGGEDEGVSDAGNIHVKPPRPCPDCDDTGWSLGDPCAVCQGPSKGAALRHVYENEKRTPAPTRPANDAVEDAASVERAASKWIASEVDAYPGTTMDDRIASWMRGGVHPDDVSRFLVDAYVAGHRAALRREKGGDK